MVMKIKNHWLGRKHTMASRRKMSESRKGRIIGPEWRKHMSEAKQRQRIRDGYILSPEVRRKVSESKKGIPRPEWVKVKLRGANGGGWKGGVSTINHLIRENIKYRQWRSDIFHRDDFTCKMGGERGGVLNAHHIKPLSLIIKENNIKTLEQALVCEEIWDLNNGITVCEKCHRLTETYGTRTKHNKMY